MVRSENLLLNSERFTKLQLCSSVVFSRHKDLRPGDTSQQYCWLAELKLSIQHGQEYELIGDDRPIIRRMDDVMLATMTDNPRRWALNVLGGRAPNTVAALKSDWRLFTEWCAANGRPPFPASQDTLEAFCNAQAASKRVTTIRRYLATVGSVHMGAGLPSPASTSRIKDRVKALQAAQGKVNKRARDADEAVPFQQRQAAGLRETHILEYVDAHPVRAARDARTVALLWCAHDTLLRASELREIRWRDFQSASDGSQVLAVPFAKDSREVTYRYVSRTAWDALKEWRTMAIDASQDPALFEGNDRVFRTVRGKRTIDDTAMTRQAIWRTMKTVAARLGLDPALFSAHSTRVGTAQDMLEADIGLMAVMSAGGWKTSAMPQHYAKAIDVRSSGAAKLARINGRSEKREE